MTLDEAQKHGSRTYGGAPCRRCSSNIRYLSGIAFDARSPRPERLSKLMGPATLPAVLEICDELALPHVQLCHPAIESPTYLTHRLALLGLNGTMRGTGKSTKCCSNCARQNQGVPFLRKMKTL
jgi:hypothetical protein